MEQVIDQELFAREFFDLFEETFVTHHGIYLDRGTSLFQTLEGITAEEASRPVGGKCATLTAQVTHIIFYMEVLERYIVTGDARDVDWGEIWRRVKGATPEEWAALQGQLRQTYERISALLHDEAAWNKETSVGGALAMLVHSAYHLGEIRQALCTLK